MKAKQIVVTYKEDETRYVPLFTNGGVLREADGSVKLWHKPY